MGNNSAKHINVTQSNGSYQQFYDSLSETNKNEIDLNSLDPYKVLNVPKDFTWNQLKSAYRNAALKTHPDKTGGNKLIFDYVTSCFQNLAQEYNARVSNKTHSDLKQGANDYFEKMVSNDIPHPSSVIQPDTNEPFNKKFNKAFDDCKYYDEEVEYGYGNIMANSSGSREDISIDNVFKKGKVDNSTFNDVFNKNVPVTKSVVKYKEPEALIMAKQLQFTEIGSKRPDDYSSTDNKSLAYTDYMVAYNGMRLANPEDIKLRKEFKSVKEYTKYRESKAKKELTDKEKKYLEKEKLKEEQMEFERQERIKSQNIAIQKAHDKANQLLIR